MNRKYIQLAFILTGHVIFASVTWRDIKRRPAGQIRGSKNLWRILSAVNTLGSTGYWLIGRRYGRSQADLTA
ncbi:MAG: hypothetical protein ABSA02_35805 [Trebonia sp.]|jgi:hypothetical protein